MKKRIATRWMPGKQLMRREFSFRESLFSEDKPIGGGF